MMVCFHHRMLGAIPTGNGGTKRPMEQNLAELISWFPSGTAEGEKPILDRVFVYVNEFASIMAPPIGNPYLLIGPKGSGKSAIIDFAIRTLNQQEVPAIVLTPADIDTTTLGENSSTGDMTRTFGTIMMSAIAGKLAESSTGWFDGDKATLYREAIDAKIRSPDFVGRMGRFLADLSKPLTKIDFNAAFPHLTSVTKKELEAALDRALNTKSFYIFIDDTDQIANPDKPGHLNRIWALILAVRRLTANIPEIRAVVSLRSEVWERLKVDPAGQRDQTDHFESLKVILKSDKEHVGKIIDRRLGLASARLNSGQDIYAPFFYGADARAPFSDDRRTWRDLIVVRSRSRPRDAIQLVNALARRADLDKVSLVQEDTFRSVMPIHSERIAKDFAKEVALECPVALEILRTFAGLNFDSGAFTMSAKQALQHFSGLPTRFGITLYGIVLRPQQEADILELWRFFYLTGVINARASDSSEKDGYKHLDPDKDPTLVSKSRWNDVQKHLWEINTVYRDYLITVDQEQVNTTGLPFKLPTQHRRLGNKRRRG